MTSQLHIYNQILLRLSILTYHIHLLKTIQNEYYRIGDWKFVKGTTYDGEWDNWYGPSGRTGYTYPMQMVR